MATSPIGAPGQQEPGRLPPALSPEEKKIQDVVRQKIKVPEGTQPPPLVSYKWTILDKESRLRKFLSFLPLFKKIVEYFDDRAEKERTSIAGKKGEATPAELQSAIRLGSSEAAVTLGKKAVEEKHPEDAKIYFKRALELSEKHDETCRQIGSYYEERKDIDNAIFYYEKREKKNSSDLAKLGDLCLKATDPQIRNANEYYERAANRGNVNGIFGMKRCMDEQTKKLTSLDEAKKLKESFEEKVRDKPYWKTLLETEGNRLFQLIESKSELTDTEKENAYLCCNLTEWWENPVTCRRLGFCFEKGIGVEKDLAIAASKYNSKPLVGNQEIEKRLTDWYEQGIHLGPREALEHYSTQTRNFFTNLPPESKHHIFDIASRCYNKVKSKPNDRKSQETSLFGICSLLGIGTEKNISNAVQAFDFLAKENETFFLEDIDPTILAEIWVRRMQGLDIEKDTIWADNFRSKCGLAFGKEHLSSALKRLGDMAWKEKNYSLAIATFRSMGQYFPGEKSAAIAKLNEMGLYFQKSNNPDAAYQCFQSAWILGDTSPDILKNLLQSSPIGIKTPEEARTDARNLMLIGEKFESIDPDVALECYKRAASDPSRAGLEKLKTLSQDLLRQGELDKALDVLKHIYTIEKKPELLENFYMLCKIGDNQEMLKKVTSCLTTHTEEFLEEKGYDYWYRQKISLGKSLEKDNPDIAIELYKAVLIGEFSSEEPAAAVEALKTLANLCKDKHEWNRAWRCLKLVFAQEENKTQLQPLLDICKNNNFEWDDEVIKFIEEYARQH